MKRDFPVLEMTCAACAVSVESIVATLPGVQRAAVNYANQLLSVEYDANQVQPAAIQEAVQSIGYDLIIGDDREAASQEQEQNQQEQYRRLRNDTLLAGVFAVPVAIIGMFFMHEPWANAVMLVLTAPVLFGFGRRFFSSAWKLARHGQANMDTLVALSTGIAFAFSAFNTFFPHYFESKGITAHVYFEAAAVVVFFILLGKLLEARAKARTSSAIKKLMGLQPNTVSLRVDGQFVERPIASVQPGDYLRVRPGERIAVDGILEEGESYVDESMISGEPVPVLKTAGSEVLAGTVNQKGSFVFVARSVGGATLLARIIRTVEQAQGSKAPVQRLTDRIAAVFVPVVLGIAALTFAVWMLAGGESALAHALLTSITVLVIACPCALGLATPTAIIAGVGRGAEHGILIKDAESLETAHRVDTVVLDKTGTLTEGKPSVRDWRWRQDTRAEDRAVLLALEQHSEHPLASAIVAGLEQESLPDVPIEGFQSVTGKGVTAAYAGRSYSAGSIRWLEEQGVVIEAGWRTQLEAWQEAAGTVVGFSANRTLLALVNIADPIRPGSAEAVARLKDAGIRVYMLTGDNRHTAAAVARQTGIAEFQAEMLPSGKSDFIRALREQGRIVAMVGDGINDSEALALADISVAMGKGSDIALEVAQMALLQADLRRLPQALRLSGRTVRTIRQNLFWAFFYNVVGIPIAAGLLYPFNGFLLNPMLAGAAMALSSVSVVSNSLRLRTLKLER